MFFRTRLNELEDFEVLMTDVCGSLPGEYSAVYYQGSPAIYIRNKYIKLC